MIGYYVHHHGDGHAARAAAVINRLSTPAVVLTSHPAGFPCETIRLPPDFDGCEAPARRPRELHYAPLGSPGLAGRMAAIAAWIDRAHPSLFVVDVSVEVAALARLCGSATILIRQHGERNDEPHEVAYRWASHLLAPYPKWFEDPSAHPGTRAKTSHVGAFSRFDDEPRPSAPGRDAARVLLVAGRGPLYSEVAASAEASRAFDRVERAGNPMAVDELAGCSVVFGAAGSNLVAEAAYARRGLIALPEVRPFDEQHARARLLDRNRMAVVIDRVPGPDAWRELHDRAAARAQRLATLVDGRGAERAAAELERWARTASPRWG